MTKNIFERVDARPRLVVVGNGMVGHRFVEAAAERGILQKFAAVVVSEESRLAYDRVNLSKWFEGMSDANLSLVSDGQYEGLGVEIVRGEAIVGLDREARLVRFASGAELQYDELVLATGSYPFVPPIPGKELPGCFVYRTIDDLEAIRGAAGSAKRAAVIGGGLLGLEAAKALLSLGLETHVIEFAPRLMPLQVDEAGAKVLRARIEELGVRVHVSTSTREIAAGEDGRVAALRFADGRELPLEMVVFSAGIRPRDELARSSGLNLGERGGIAIDGTCRTSDPRIFAIGECAVFEGKTYGLVAPGYRMADVAAATLAGEEHAFNGFDMSTKLKLLGVDVGSFGDAFATTPGAQEISIFDGASSLYKKLVVSADKTKLLGGVLVGDASAYSQLLAHVQTGMKLPEHPEELVLPAREGGKAGFGVDALPDAALICSCHNVDKGQICGAIREQKITAISGVKSCTKAGTGCGSCVSLVDQLLKHELKRAGIAVNNHLCEHFPHSRQELAHLVRIHELHSFDELIERHGRGQGCEICKPAVGSILASTWNEYVLRREHVGLQDTNDRYLANIQKDGTYSVVPRLAGGEVTPDQLIVLGQVAKKYGLYSKVTGGQRIDLFGARLDQLPAIWAELVAAGFESGHAYGKALRTVKSCVGSTWCRYGVQDSVGAAVRIENRYKGLRAPHKIKGGVSGCARECAEAQSKDFGVIATERGFNLYVCGNGGMKPQHAVLLATDVDEEMLVRYLDRFLMFYVRTADRLQRTASWLNNLEGGIEYLKAVVIEDSLGICAELEADMARIVGSYRCEWKTTLENPKKMRSFRAFVNSDEPDPSILFVTERAQHRPATAAEKRSLLETKKIRLPVYSA
ncbi:MAG TPA: nitrite reductase large subunit NirB [Polyangiaceae bacterium]|jgi:nitrite reductase (NADH) large subunit|nr:nitrite reductase large subunit NirB [Polyangiaceae bacterium]